MSFNANSVGKNPKRQKVLGFLKKKNPDFLILLDTRICPSIENTIREEWGSKCFFSSLNSQSRGVAVFLKKGLNTDILDIKTSPDGNLLALLFEYEGRKILLRGVYGPNEDNPQFYQENVFHFIDMWEPELSLFVGDYNVTINPVLDNRNYMHENNILAREALKNKINEFELVDIWRELNPQETLFSWHKFRRNKQARLDY